MSRGSVRLLTFASGRRELGFDFSLRGPDKISRPTSGHRVLKPHEFLWFFSLFFVLCFLRRTLRRPEVGVEILPAPQSENSNPSFRRPEPKVKSLTEPLDTQKFKCYTDLWTPKNSNRTSGHQKLKSATQHPDDEKFKF